MTNTTEASGQPRVLVRGGTVVSENGAYRADVLIDETGVIESVTAGGTSPTADEVIDARGLLVLPGAVDGHTHLNDPGFTESEDFLSGTMGAAAGGITTVVEMPLTVPIVDNEQTFVAKRAIGSGKSVVDFALWGALTADNAADGEDIRRLAAQGAVGLKAFTSDDPAIRQVPDALLLRGMKAAAAEGLLVGVHCEDQILIDEYAARLKAAGRNDPRINPESRPPAVEIEAVHRVLTLARLSGARVQFVHLSQPVCVDLVQDARREGLPVTAETCPHFLCLDESILDQVGPYAMCNPPLRSKKAQKEMWRRIRGGSVDTIGSDHGPFTEEEKTTGDMWAVPPGITGIELMVPLLVGEALQRDITLGVIVQLLTANPARILGLYPKKGAIQPGSDGDLALIDCEAPWTVRSKDLYSRAQTTAYEGRVVDVRVVRTIVRGRTVYDDSAADERIRMAPGYGRFVPRSAPPDPACGPM